MGVNATASRCIHTCIAYTRVRQCRSNLLSSFCQFLSFSMSHRPVAFPMVAWDLHTHTPDLRARHARTLGTHHLKSKQASLFRSMYYLSARHARSPGTAMSPRPSKLNGKLAASPVPPASRGNSKRVGPVMMSLVATVIITFSPVGQEQHMFWRSWGTLDIPQCQAHDSWGERTHNNQGWDKTTNRATCQLYIHVEQHASCNIFVCLYLACMAAAACAVGCCASWMSSSGSNT